MTNLPAQTAAATEALLASVAAAAAAPSATQAQRDAALQYLASLVSIGGPVAPSSAGVPAVTQSSPAPIPVAAAPAPTPTASAPAPADASNPRWVAGTLYNEVPLEHIASVVADNGDGWYGVIIGRSVGLTQSNAAAGKAVVGITSNSMKSHKTLAGALFTFNHALDLGLVEVRQH
ncbi:hypothetical protein C8R43DRAFT_1118045 [Mycena crocata]|nr:hypothetical protein C8R43DRAFT_1118045 [Mycena crocata]